MKSKSYAMTQGLRGSYPLHIIHNRMGLKKGRILIRGNLLGYVKLSKVQKDMELQKKHLEEERELCLALVM